jgi:ATP-binding cassette subfamily B (MDR/TAP) protein 1
MYAGEHTTQRLREEYLAAILRQNISFFDDLGAGEITSTITANMDLVQIGISEKVGTTITALTMFVTALIVAFIYDWRLACVLLSEVAAGFLIIGACSTFIVRYSRAALEAYSVGGTTAEEAISSIQTVTAFNGQEKLSKRYENSLISSMHWGFRAKRTVSSMVAAFMSLIYLGYGLGFWEGARLLVAGHATLAHTLTVCMAMLSAAVSFGHAAPNLRAFGEGTAAAENIFKVIDRRAPIAQNMASTIPNQVRGALEFRNVKHIYPSRPEVTVLEDFNLIVPC